MYCINKKSYGLMLTLGGVVSAEEMSRWLDDLCQAVEEQSEGFCVFVDMRTLVPIDKDGQILVQEGQEYAKQHGMARSVVILNSPVTTMQFKQIAMDTGIYDWERYIDASKHPNWKQLALDWVERAVDPDLENSTKEEESGAGPKPNPVCPS